MLEKGFSGLESQLDQEYGGLMEKMGTLHDQITGTRKDIPGLVKMIEESGEPGDRCPHQDAGGDGERKPCGDA